MTRCDIRRQCKRLYFLRPEATCAWLGFTELAVGVWLLWPGTRLTVLPFPVLAVAIPKVVIGAWFVAIGAYHFVGVFCERAGWRIGASLASLCTWAGLTLGTIFGSWLIGLDLPGAVATAVYPCLAMQACWAFWRIRNPGDCGCNGNGGK